MHISVKLDMTDSEGWRALVPMPFWTTKGLPFWKRFNEKNWLPQCTKEQDIFKTRLEYDRHFAIMHFPWPSGFEIEGWQKFVGTEWKR